MKLKNRYITQYILSDLVHRKMVFIGGPRQVGKTTLALRFLKDADESHPAYLNWDQAEARHRIMRNELPPTQKLLILDEIHKYARWRNWIKGVYDTQKSRIQLIVTGSARLDYYRKGGDSLQGRYHYYRLHPLSAGELSKTPSRKDIELLLQFGGFPDPFFRGEEDYWRRWQRERLERVLYEDLRDLERVKEVSLIELLLDSLPERVGSPLSVKSLKEVLQVSHESVERWIEILERMYICFRIAPFGAPKIRAVKKERKLYFWDWSMVENPGVRFENLVASHLLKYCHFIEDTRGYSMELRYIRDTDKREIDFVVLRDRRPEFAVECKTGERSIGPAIHYFKERTKIPHFYQVHLGNRDFQDAFTGTRVLPFHRLCEELGIP